MIKLYIFSSRTTRNVEIAFEQKMWAVHDIDEKHYASRKTKALKMPKGAHGLFYISARSAFTMPFTVESVPEEKVIKDVWPGEWHFPFPINPLGPPWNFIKLSDAMRQWVTLKNTWNPTTEIQLSGGMAFVASDIAEVDWMRITKELC